MKNQKSFRQSGLSMIEILITILILAVGFLGVAGMQLLNLKTVNNTQYRTLATLHAYDMAERMRTNVDGVSGGFYEISTRPSSASSCTTCTAQQLAEMDAYQWNNQIRVYGSSPSVADLPNGQGTVANVSGTDFYDITVSWQEQSRDSGVQAVTAESFVLRVRI